jgi:hypothetical protein
LVVPVLAALAACGGDEPVDRGFAYVEPAAPTTVVLLRNDSSRTPTGHRVAELDVLLPLTTGEAAARATLQHVIDSVALADTLAAAVRVTGFVMGDVDTATASADLLPAIRATWGPVDTAGYTGRQRRSRFRTDYVLLRPFGTTATGERRP